MSERQQELTRRTIEAFNAQDLDRFAAGFVAEPEIVPLRGILEGTSYAGPDAVLDFWRDTTEMWDQIELELREFRDAADALVVIGTLRTRGRGSGADTELLTGWTVRFDGDRIASLRTHGSVDEALEAAG